MWCTRGEIDDCVEWYCKLLRDAHTASVPFNYVNLNILFNDIWIMYIEAPSESFAIPRMLKCQEVW